LPELRPILRDAVCSQNGVYETQIDNYATFHNAPGDLDKGGTNIVSVDGHVELLPRVKELNEGFRLAWPKKGSAFLTLRGICISARRKTGKRRSSGGEV
jgi:hypothetical protein